jgi:hypothetical protein
VVGKSDIFIQEFVLGFGFLGGLFAWAGVDPEEEVVKALLRVAIPNNELLVSLVIVLFVLGSTAMGIYGTLQVAGQLGLAVVGMAWVSGFTIGISSLSLVGVILLILALVLASIVCDNYKG